MAYLPKKDSLRDRVCRAVLKYGPMHMDQIFETFKGERSNAVKETVFHLKFFGALKEANGDYSLAEYIRCHYTGEEMPKVEPVIPAPSVRAFKPWTGKYDPLNGLRREEIRRDVGFKNGSVGFSAGYVITGGVPVRS